jgi:hypothetical protein
MVHPIERLRYVARSSGAPQDLMVRETASALASFGDDPSGLVTACRRIVSRQLTAGSLWWLCSRMLCAADPLREARLAVDEIEDDSSPRQLAHALADGGTVLVIGWPPQVAEGLARRGDLEVLVADVGGDGSSLVGHLQHREVDAIDVPAAGLGAAAAEADLVILEAGAAGPEQFVATAGSRAAAAVAHDAGKAVWLVAGVGRVLPARVWQALTDRLDDLADSWDLDEEVVPLSLVDTVIGPNGSHPPAELVLRCDCPIAPELFKPDIT